MLFKPPVKLAVLPPVGILLANGTVLLEGGSVSAIADVSVDTTVYTLSHDIALQNLCAIGGKAFWWKRRYSKYEIEGLKILSLRDMFQDKDPGEALQTMIVVRDWLFSHGVRFSSLPGSSLQLWRRTLPKPLLVARRKFPVPEDMLSLGGRQEYNAGLYPSADHFDIRAAYTWALRETPVPASYSHVDRVPIEALADKAGFVRCFVRFRRDIEPPPYGPLPVRSGRQWSYPTSGVLEGVFDIREIELAHMLGARIIVHEAWMGRGLRLPFEEWSDLIEEGRGLGGDAGALVKVMGNSLWGFFASEGAGATVYYADGRRAYTVRDERDKRALCRPLAAHVTAAIRRRLYMESLGTATISAHTDGVFFPSGVTPVGTLDDPGIGEWRRDMSVRDLVVLTAQIFSYVADTGERVYAMSGVPIDSAKQAFRAVISTMERRGELRSGELRDAVHIFA